MPLGILEPKDTQEVPGTCQLSDDPNQKALEFYKGVDVSALKHGKGKYSDIILVPQPSDDPNDPLNWPSWKKHTTYFTLTYGTVLCGALGPLVTADIIVLAAEFHVSIQAMSRALGTSIVTTLAIATLVWSMLSVTWGKRPVYLAGTLFMIAGCMVTAEAKTYNVLLGGRILQGTGQAVLEFLVGSTLAEIYYLHERGVPVAIWNLALLNGINITPPVAGQVLQHLGFRWCFRIFSIASVVLLILQIFFMPETVYKRKPIPLTQPNHFGTESETHQASEKDEIKSPPSSAEEGGQGASIPMRSYLQSLRVFSGRHNIGESPWLLVWRPFALLSSPTVLWAILVYGTAITWLVFVAAALAQLFSGPPYHFTEAQIGLTYMSPFVFTTIAAVVCGPLADYVTRRMSRANNGVFEPEFKLPLVAFYAVFGGMGFFGWAISAHLGEAWIGPVMFFGILNFGVVIGCSAAISYVVDCHRASADAALGALIFGKNVFSAVVTTFVNDWINAKGVLSTFSTIGGLVLICSAFTIPMYIYGKRARLFIHRKYNITS
ncbi:major facilitator superfamily domain-containing protein [Gautieria morchelliformis]|nr:major facilitator superfamily domain-containing protein [Gautieria morchelliformis]